jgi:hypothetical protein
MNLFLSFVLHAPIISFAFINNTAYHFLSDSRFSKQPYQGLWCTKITKLNRSDFWKSSVTVENDLLYVCSSLPVSVLRLKLGLLEEVCEENDIKLVM